MRRTIHAAHISITSCHSFPLFSPLCSTFFSPSFLSSPLSQSSFLLHTPYLFVYSLFLERPSSSLFLMSPCSSNHLLPFSHVPFSPSPLLPFPSHHFISCSSTYPCSLFLHIPSLPFSHLTHLPFSWKHPSSLFLHNFFHFPTTSFLCFNPCYFSLFFIVLSYFPPSLFFEILPPFPSPYPPPTAAGCTVF